MAIITISRGCFSHGKEIAERVAARLGYECISSEVLMEASHFFNIPEQKLSKSIHELPGILDRFTHRPQHFLDCIQAALLEHVRKDNVVYHGHAGHFFLSGIAHVLKIRVIAEMDDRLALLRKQKGISLDKAAQLIEEEDRQREVWVHHLYKKDMSDPALYDMLVHVGR
jgi:cytidylate kinase